MSETTEVLWKCANAACGVDNNEKHYWGACWRCGQPRASESDNDGVSKQCCDADIDLCMANIALQNAKAERDRYKALAGELANLLMDREGMDGYGRKALARAREAGLL